MWSNKLEGRLLFSLLLLSAFPIGAQESESPGHQVFAANCAFCHGSNARGGAQGGPDLTQSAIVQADQNGRQLGAFLQVGRPDKGMPAFKLSAEKVQALGAFLHATIRAASRQPDLGVEVLVGDAAAGKIFFNGAGNCAHCHSETSDLKGIGSKYSPAVLQGRLVLPIGRGGYPGLSLPEPPRLQVTVTKPATPALSGQLLFLSDYAVTLLDSAGTRHTIPRHGDLPKVVVRDPLQAHLDRQSKLTDAEMHNLTAYLATLK